MPSPKLKGKRWDFKCEKAVYEKWQKLKLYPKPTVKGRVFVVDTPPPYPSGRWHMGGAMHYSQIDMIARYWRMSKGNTWFPVGIDRNGLPIESRVEKDYKVKAHEVGREKFLALCKKKLDEYEENISDVMGMMGLSMDWEEPYRTDSPEFRAMTQATFIELWKKGLIYEDTKPNNWCPGCKTTLADAEVEYKQEKTRLVHIKFPGKKDMVIATTRPELVGACQALIVHPEDKRFKAGGKVTVPLYDREVPVIAHEMANPEFGTGAMMICSYGDQEDVRLFRELELPETVIIGQDGRMNKKSGKYEDLTIHEARDAIIKDLKKGGFIKKTEELEHSVPVCWRSKDEIELITLPEFYLKQIDFLKDIRKIADKMKFHPPWMKQLLLDWIDGVSQDWPISRRRFYGTPVPIFYCPEHGAWVPEPGKYYESWKEELRCPRCNKVSKGDQRVLDTWMDSSISPLWVSHYKRDGKFFDSSFPTFLRPQGKDIVRTWLFYTLLRVCQLTGKEAFEHVWISGHVVDEHGKKMSKSVGNIIYPEPLVEKYGADAVRFQGAAEAKLGSDIRISEERIAGAGKFIQKLYNVSRFISMFPDEEGILKPTDKWMLSELSSVVETATKGYEDMDMFVPANAVKNFVWDLFASHYIELVKSRAYGGDKGAPHALHTALKTVLKLLAPIMPFVTDHIYNEMYGENIHTSGFPKPIMAEKHPTRGILAFNEKVWAEKKKKGLSLRDEISMEIPEELKPYEEDLVNMHKVRQ